MTVIRDVCDAGHAVISTIHQPSTELFEMFDNMLLLQRGGNTVYFGPLGASSTSLTNYLTRHGADAIQAHENPADYMLRELAIDPSEGLSWKDAWLASPEHKATTSFLESPDFLKTVKPVVRNSSEYPGAWTQVYHVVSSVDLSELVRLILIFASMAHRINTRVSAALQLGAITSRAFRSYWRDSTLNLSRLVFQCFLGSLFGLTYFQLGYSQANLSFRIAAIFFTSILGIIAALGAMNPIFAQRSLFYREHDS